MSKKKFDQVLGHADEADGIEEYDNPLPDWWLGMLWLTVGIAVVYTADYHFIRPTSQADMYLAEMEAAEAKWPQSKQVAELDMGEASVAAGAEIYAANCLACHGANLEGGIGPNLGDSVWIHGDSNEAIQATITNGVSTAGMPAWGPILGPQKVAQVAAFVVSKKGSLPDAEPAAGAAEGDEPAVAALDPMAEDAIDDAVLAAGAEVYKANCAACHLDDLTGQVGPNLVDDEWIHGGDIASITKTVNEGVPAKGMVTWGPILGEEKVRQVSAYVWAKSHGE